METNIILAGVGGQGILSISLVIDTASLKQGLSFKQSEVHGMSQRGGAVQSHLRLADHTLYSDLVPKGRGTLILSVEPLETLRYIDTLSPEGMVISGVDPMINISDYPDVETLLDRLGELPHHILVHADRLAREAGSGRAQNMVLLGAASPYLGLREELLEEGIREAFGRKGERVQKINLEAFAAGKAVGQAYLSCLGAGLAPRQARALVGRLSRGILQAEAVPLWKELFSGALSQPLLEAFARGEKGKISGSVDLPRSLLAEGDAVRARLPDALFR